MHGLNSHTGDMAPDSHVVFHEPVTAPTIAAPLSGVHEVMGTAVHDVAVATATGADEMVDGVSSGHMGMTAMCMAVMAMALMVLLRMLGGSPTLPLYRRVGAPARAPGPHGRDPDPPSLTALSIRRC